MVSNNTEISDFSEFDDTPDVGLNLTPLEEPSVTEATVSDTTAPAEEIPAPTAEVPPEPTPLPNSDTAQLQKELSEMKQQQNEQQRERQINQLEQEALQMERRLLDQGLSETEARSQTMTHLQGKVSQIQAVQQQRQQQELMQGKRNAAVHYAKQYGLGIDDLANLERANTPQEMESIAKTQSTIAKQAAEIEQLKRGQVPSQQLDNNSPAPSANATSSQRLVDAYLQGDRSPEAVEAVRKQMQG